MRSIISMNTELFIPILAGTTRKNNNSIHVAKLIAKVGNDIEGVSTQLVDPNDFSFPGDGNDEGSKDPKYTEIVKKADGFFMVIPEYNHSFPGSLKRMIDSELKLYIHKPVAFAGVSAGPWGGTRGIESMVNVVRELGLVATFADAHFPGVHKLFNEKGELQDDSYVRRVKRSIEELVWMATALKWGRENVTSQ